ncbi:MAG: hypothetical protein ACI4WX_11565 [Aristaeellaceae bacterium]
MENFEHIGKKEIICRYIRKNGRIIYPRNSKFFHFWVDVTKNASDRREHVSMFDDEDQK